MLESIQAMSLLTIMEVPGPLLLAAALIYGTVQWSRRDARCLDDRLSSDCHRMRALIWRAMLASMLVPRPPLLRTSLSCSHGRYGSSLS